jgi:hypothetical protein
VLGLVRHHHGLRLVSRHGLERRQVLGFLIGAVHADVLHRQAELLSPLQELLQPERLTEPEEGHPG